MLSLAIHALTLGPNSAVICHGADGHVTIKAAIYGHCHCIGIGFYQELINPDLAIHDQTHEHCHDSPLNFECTVDWKDSSASAPSDQLINKTAGTGSGAEDWAYIDSSGLRDDMPGYPTSVSFVVLRL